MRKGIPLLLVLALATSVSTMAGTKEEVIRLQRDVHDLQVLIRAMREDQEKSSGVLQSLLEQLNDQIADNNAAVRSLTDVLRARSGGSEVLAAQMRDGFQQMTLKLDDTNNRVAALQQKLTENQLKSEVLRSYSPGTGSLEPDRAYGVAYNDYLMGNYDLAIAAFQDFLSSFPDSQFAANAAYYLGDSQMKKQRYEPALKAFDEVLNLHPNADNTAPTYYKKGLALVELRRNTEAIETFRKLITIFPDSSEASLARQELERLGIDPEELSRKPG